MKQKRGVKKNLYTRNFYRYYLSIQNRCFLSNSSKDLSVHHIIPQYLGGNDSPWNLMTLTREIHDLIEKQGKHKKKKYINLSSEEKEWIDKYNKELKERELEEFCWR
jgi:5-methylcytosine-specific restriction endonuclease McrA